MTSSIRNHSYNHGRTTCIHYGVIKVRNSLIYKSDSLVKLRYSKKIKIIVTSRFAPVTSHAQLSERPTISFGTNITMSCGEINFVLAYGLWKTKKCLHARGVRHAMKTSVRIVPRAP
jgi:hypothetical protein